MRMSHFYSCDISSRRTGMKKLTLTLAALLLSISAHAEQRRGSDLTYCLALPTAPLIAKCSGERAGGGKGPIMSRAQVDKLLAKLSPPDEKTPVASKPETPAPAVTPSEEIKPEEKTEIPLQQ
jgi:hypothetical protein